MPTALELGHERWQSYLGAAGRNRDRFPGGGLTPSEREGLMKKVRKIAAELKIRYHAKRVILFGSLAHHHWYESDSDVDIAVEGLAVDDYWQAWKLAEEVITERPVDLVEMEMASESLKASINRYGVEI
jgi:predicted nucleotidyltransferase